MGRALTTSGTINTSATAIISSPSGCMPFVLSMNQLDFRGKPCGQDVLLEWNSALPNNIAYFDLEKSADAINFNPMVKIFTSPDKAKAGFEYTTTDQNPYQIGYYRISEMDNDGQNNYSPTIEVKMNTDQNFKALSYVRQNDIVIYITGASAGKGLIELYSIDGRKVESLNIVLTKEQGVYFMARPKITGVCVIVLSSQKEKLYAGKLALF
ncbi:MAG: hypothetical protein ABIY90_04030 [Puia sp.]